MASSSHSAPRDAIDSPIPSDELGSTHSVPVANGELNGPQFSNEAPFVPLASDSDKTVIRNRPVAASHTPTGVGSASGNLSNGSAGRSPRSAWQSTAESLIGQRLDHFQIESLVGIGGMEPSSAAKTNA